MKTVFAFLAGLFGGFICGCGLHAIAAVGQPAYCEYLSKTANELNE